MNINDFFEIENEIKNSINKALNYADDQINYHVGGVLNEVKNQLRRSEDFLNNMGNKTYNKVQNLKYSPSKNTSSPYIARKPAERVKGALYSVLGVVSSIFWGLGTFGCILAAGIDNKVISSGGAAAAIFSGTLFAVSMVFAFKGNNIKNRNKRFKKYAEKLAKTNYCKIDTLAKLVFKDNKFVINDLYKMMELDMFKEGHLDDKNTHFMLGDDVYEAYLNAQKSYEERIENENIEKDSELDSVIKLGQRYVREIRDANDCIPGEIISKKLYRLENVVDSIFKSIEKDPSKLPSVKKFIDHYLPMTLKLVNSYKELDRQAIQGENITKAKLEIEKSIDLVNTAFEKLLDDLFQDMAMDISSDISVLKTLFTQEGLAEDNLKKER